jgi:hypothetical protein
MTTSAAGSSANRTDAGRKRQSVPLLLQLPDLRVETVEEEPIVEKPIANVPENASAPTPKPPVKRRIIHSAHRRLKPALRRSAVVKTLKKAAMSSWAQKATIAGGGVALILAAYYVLNGFQFRSGIPETTDASNRQPANQMAKDKPSAAWENSRWADASTAPRWAPPGKRNGGASEPKPPVPKAKKAAPPPPVNSKKLQGSTGPKKSSAAKPRNTDTRPVAPRPNDGAAAKPRESISPRTPRGEMVIERHETRIDNPHVRGGVDSLPRAGGENRLDEWCPPGMPSPQNDAIWNTRDGDDRITPAADPGRYQGRPIYDRNHDGYRGGYAPQNDRTPLEASRLDEYGALPAPPSNQRPGAARLTGGITEYR